MTYAKALLLSALAVFAPIKAMLFASLALVVFDSITGVWAARKRGEPITSAGFRRTISKGVVYMFALCAAHLLEVYLLNKLVPVVSLVAGVLGLVEGKSVFENLNTVSGGALFAKVVSALGSANDKRAQ